MIMMSSCSNDDGSLTLELHDIQDFELNIDGYAQILLRKWRKTQIMTTTIVIKLWTLILMVKLMPSIDPEVSVTAFNHKIQQLCTLASCVA